MRCDSRYDIRCDSRYDIRCDIRCGIRCDINVSTSSVYICIPSCDNQLLH